MEDGMDASITKVLVARGRSIQIGNQVYLPGETAPILTSEVEFMRQAGYVHDPETVIVIRTPMRDPNNLASVGLQQTTES